MQWYDAAYKDRLIQHICINSALFTIVVIITIYLTMTWFLLSNYLFIHSNVFLYSFIS